MYSYDKPLHSMVALPVAAGTATFVTRVTADMSSDKQRLLKTVAILGVAGVVGTAGAMTINFGDGTNPARYGVFTMDNGLAAGAPITGKLVLTEDGYNIGYDDTVPYIVTATLAGPGLPAAGGSLIIGYY